VEEGQKGKERGGNGRGISFREKSRKLLYFFEGKECCFQEGKKDRHLLFDFREKETDKYLDVKLKRKRVQVFKQRDVPRKKKKGGKGRPEEREEDTDIPNLC